jgi:hypothetical protein
MYFTISNQRTVANCHEKLLQMPQLHARIEFATQPARDLAVRAEGGSLFAIHAG